MASAESASNIKNDIQIPSTCKSEYFIYALNQTTQNNQMGDEKIGKWMIFRPRKTIDDAWETIKKAVTNGLLGHSAKVSTRMDKSGKFKFK